MRGKVIITILSLLSLFILTIALGGCETEPETTTATTTMTAVSTTKTTETINATVTEMMLVPTTIYSPITIYPTTVPGSTPPLVSQIHTLERGDPDTLFAIYLSEGQTDLTP